MAIRAWLDGDLRLAIRLLQWANPSYKNKIIENYVEEDNEYNAA